MRSAVLLVVSVTLGSLASGCRKKNEESSKALGSAIDSVTTDGGVFAEPGAGANLTFAIKALYENQKRTTTTPFHEPGGDWTFFDAEMSDGARFGFGFSKYTQEKFAFAHAVLTTPDRDQAKKLIALFAQRFGGTIPPEKSPEPLEPTSLAISILGTGMRPIGGAYSGTGGNWHATKLLLQRSGLEAEIFFNFSLADKRGEFAEKDSEYANDLVAFLALELRDGPRPQRTPATDPSMIEHGPQIEWKRVIDGRPYGMAPARDAYWVVEQTGVGTRVVSTPFDKDERTEIVRVPHQVGSITCNQSLAVCLVEDVQREDANSYSSNDPRSFLLVDRKKKTTTPIKAPWPAFSPVSVSAGVPPDGSFVVMTVFVQKPLDPKLKGIYVVDPDGTVRGPVNDGEGSLDVAGFSGTGPGLRVIIERERKDRHTKQDSVTYVALDPKTMTTTPAERPKGRPTPSEKYTTSPDGKRTVASKGGKIVIRDIATGSEVSFDVHEDDHKACEQGCVSWANNRYLEYRANVHGFLDTETRKLNAADVGGGDYSADFKWVVENGKQLRVGQVVIR